MFRMFGLVGVCAALAMTACTYAGEGDRLGPPRDSDADYDWGVEPLRDGEDNWDGFERPAPEADATRCAKGIKPSEVVAVDPSEHPQTGQMQVRQGDQVVALPLAETSFDTVVLGMIADTEVRQVFVNPFEDPIEAVYVFPLPHDAAVDDYAIEIGDRTIRGVMKTRQQAREMYEAARLEGRRAGLLEQERPNIFTQSLANILPGESITVVMHMVGPVTRDRSHFEIALPTVIGPRFVPGAPVGTSGGGFSPDTDRVPDGSKITPKVLPPGYVSCAELSVHIELDAGAPIEALASKAHEITVTEDDDRRFIELSKTGEQLNRDFVLGWSLGTKAPTTSLMLGPQEDEGYFQLSVMPPKIEHAGEPVPRELVFVLDTSGSMSGSPLDTSKRTMHGLLDQLGPDDAFQIIRFSDNASTLGAAPLGNHPDNVHKARRHIQELIGQGGTQMIEGIKAALDFPYTQGRARYVLFLTDGYIGNETEIFREADKRLDRARIFSLGVGGAPNRHLLDGLARAGRGAAIYVDNHETSQQAVETFYRRLAHPVLTDLSIEWGDLPVTDVVPARIPDLFVGQPVTVYGKMTTVQSGTATLVGWAGKERVEIPIRVEVSDAKRTDGLASMWARRRIQEIEDSAFKEDVYDETIAQRVTELALRHNVMSQYTSFVAIDQAGPAVSDGDPTRVDIPVDQVSGGITLAGTTSAESHYSVDGASASSVSFDVVRPAIVADFVERDSRYGFDRSAPSPAYTRTSKDPRKEAKKRLIRKVRRRKRPIRKCFEAAKRRKLALSRLVVQVTVQVNGQVEAVKFVRGSMDRRLKDCVEEELLDWKVSRTGREILTISLTLN